MYCSKCGATLASGRAFCQDCGRSFSIAAVAARAPMMSIPVAVPIRGGQAAISAYSGYAAVPRAEYAGFWRRCLALLIDSAVMGIGFVLILIPLIFLTGFRGFINEIHLSEDISDVGVLLFIALVFVAATVSLVFTWLYHALMESSEWQATVGKKVLGLAVTDMAGQRVSFGRSTARHFAKMITNMVPAFIGYILVVFTEKKQALHDVIAGCLVVRRNI